MFIQNINREYGFDWKHFSLILNRVKTARIIVPNKITAYKKISICYLLHPFATNRFFWLNCLHSIYNLDTLPYLFVLPESGRRWLINDDSGLKYEDYFIYDLMPQIEKFIVNIIQLEHRIIGGFSMGGATAIFMGLRYPSLFNLLFSISGAFGAAFRIGNPYAQYAGSNNLMIPTEYEHKKVWGEENSSTRTTYNLRNLLCHFEKKSWHLPIILEVGKNEYPRILDMNREAHDLLNDYKIRHIYSEQEGSHNTAYAIKAVERIFDLSKTILLDN